MINESNYIKIFVLPNKIFVYQNKILLFTKQYHKVRRKDKTTMWEKFVKQRIGTQNI